MRALVLIIGLALAGAVHAEPDGGTHAHCWHARESTGLVCSGNVCKDSKPPPSDDVCCHCVKRHCVGHGPHKPGCEPEPVLRISPYGFSPALMPVAP